MFKVPVSWIAHRHCTITIKLIFDFKIQSTDR